MSKSWAKGPLGSSIAETEQGPGVMSPRVQMDGALGIRSAPLSRSR
jgi:hypothetical protein